MKALCAEAHNEWKKILTLGDSAIDATCGRGHDTVALAACVGERGCVYAYDIQKEAVKETQKRTADLPQVRVKHASHCAFEERDVRLIVYNLGYLPRSDKTITTQMETTLASLESGKEAIALGGTLSIMCYPGHPEGAREAAAVEQWAMKQRGSLTIVRSRSPFLLLLQLHP